MSNYGHHRLKAFKTNSRAVIAALALTLLLGLVFAITPAAHAQTYQKIHDFTGGQDGDTPTAGVTMDGAGNLYGTASMGGSFGYGSVYKLKRSGSNYVLDPIVNFDYSDGAYPRARVVFGPDGLLHGTTYEGAFGSGYCSSGCGVVFKLQPPPTAPRSALYPYTETVLHAFEGFPSDAGLADYGDLIFDQTGNIYGATLGGGSTGNGVVYELSPSGSVSVLYSFTGPDGRNPANGVISDSSGNLYGTTYDGGRIGYGTVFQLSQQTGESLLHSFTNGSDGGDVYAGLVFDVSGNGNLYGATSNSPNGGGTVFELTPSGDSWIYTLIYSFSHSGTAVDCGPWASLVMDTAGNLYGTTYCDGAFGYGNVFELSPFNGGWTYTDLYDFCALGPPCSDGGNPISVVTLDRSGNGTLYGTASTGGSQGVGVVWKLTP